MAKKTRVGAKSPKLPDLTGLSELQEFRNVNVTMRVRPKTFDALDKAASLAKRTKSRLASDVLEAWLRKHGFLDDAE